MKKIFTPTIKRFSALVILIFAQVKAWAFDTTTATTVDNSPNVLSQPWIWIGITVVVAIKLLGPFTQDGKHMVVVRKKAVKKVNA